MPLTDDIKMISIDDHLIEPPGVWVDRLPAKYHDRCPHVEEITEDRVEPFYAKTVHLKKGMQVWRYEDILEPNVGLTATAGTPVKDRNFSPIRFDQMRRGTWDPVARLADMDEDGVWAQAPFPSFPGFSGNKFVFAKDKDLALLCVQAYNDFLLDEWCPAAPGRYISIIILPLWDEDACVREIERCAAKGANAITFPDNPAGLGLPSYQGTAWDGTFAAAAEAGMPLCMHFGGSKIIPFVSPDAPQAVVTTLFGITLFNSMTELVMSPVFVRHPKLKVAYAEGGIGWVPYALMRMDQVWEAYREFPLENNVDPDRRPSDTVREHIFSCFIDDPVGVGLRHDIGVERLLWESDYPHADSLWPNSRANAQKVFAEVPTDEVRRIVETNARDLFLASTSPPVAASAAAAGWQAAWQPLMNAVGTDFGDGLLHQGPDAVEAGAVRRFTEPLEFGCPLHYDRDLARAYGYPDVVAPVSSIVTFTIPPLWRPGEPAVFTSPGRDAQPARTGLGPRLTGLEPETSGYFATELGADYLAPVVVGDRLARRGGLLLACTPKETSVGRGAFVTWQYEICNSSDEVVTRIRSTAYSYRPHPDRPPSAGRCQTAPPDAGAASDADAASDAEQPDSDAGQPDSEQPDWDRPRCWEDLTVGQTLPPVRFPLSVYRLVMAAGANRDFNSIHHNSEWARGTGAPEMYANVVFLQGMWERCVRQFIGVGGRIRQLSGFRMGSFNTAGDVVTVHGQVLRVWQAGDAGLAELRLWSRNRHGISVGPGTVTVSLPRRTDRTAWGTR